MRDFPRGFFLSSFIGLLVAAASNKAIAWGNEGYLSARVQTWGPAKGIP